MRFWRRTVTHGADAPLHIWIIALGLYVLLIPSAFIQAIYVFIAGTYLVRHALTVERDDGS